MRVLALDVGDVRIGVAISDALGITAQPLLTITRAGGPADVDAVIKLVQEHGVGTIVAGLPLTLQGERGPQAKKVLGFVKALSLATPVPVTTVDERLTTVEGQRALRAGGLKAKQQKGAIDQVAAQLILQQYLETERQRRPPS
jgi:putative Holliday junction resolvase